MKIRLVRVDNCLVDVSTRVEPDEIAGLVEVELKGIMPLVVAKSTDFLVRDKVPYFRRAEVYPSLGKMIAESIVPLYELPTDIQVLWREFEKAVVAWAEEEVNGD